jgi:murein DD-endopeptidase MepM/ murein hydrolase activator NlpD
MNKKTLAKLVLAGTFLIIPQKISNSSIDNNKIYLDNIVANKLSPLEKAGLEVCGEYQEALGTDFFDFFRLIYSDKWDTSDPTSLFELRMKTEEELREGKILRDSLEQKYNKLFRENNFDSIDNKWGRIVNGDMDIPKGTYVRWGHAALDIFTKEGNEVLAPFNGVVVATGDYWQGTFVNGKMYMWNKKGFTPRMGNAVIIYNPKDKGYLAIAHLKEGVLVKVGDLVPRGKILGYVGHSGSASIKNHGEHVHAAYKLKDKEGYLRGVDFSGLLR